MIANCIAELCSFWRQSHQGVTFLQGLHRVWSSFSFSHPLQGAERLIIEFDHDSGLLLPEHIFLLFVCRFTGGIGGSFYNLALGSTSVGLHSDLSSPSPYPLSLPSLSVLLLLLHLLLVVGVLCFLFCFLMPTGWLISKLCC